jgi:very-short-patch-repair endonuclease
MLAAGVSNGAIGRGVAAGRLRRLHPGVYAAGHTALAPLAAETAALLACGTHAVLSHHTAAGLWEIRPLPQPGSDVHVTVAGRHRGRARGLRIHRTRLLRKTDVRVRSGLPLTSPARTIIDVAADLTARELERAVDEALVRRFVRERELERAVAAARGRHGAPLLAALLARRAGPTLTRSQAEEKCLALIRDAQLPEPEVNARVQGYEVDFFWRESGLVLEIDGYAFHGTRAAFERDRRKDAKLRAAGIAVLRATWRQLEEESHAVVGWLARALAWEAFRRAAGDPNLTATASAPPGRDRTPVRAGRSERPRRSPARRAAG